MVRGRARLGPGPGGGPRRTIAAARQAVIFWHFLDGIEPSEWPYHRADPANWLRQTAKLVASGQSTEPA